MTDDKKSAKGPFNLYSGATKPNQSQDPELEGSKTDKDNTASRLDPPNKDQKPAPNLAPPGFMGNKGSRVAKDSPTEKMFLEFTPEGHEDTPEIDLRVDDTMVEGNLSDGTRFIVKPEYSQNSEGEIARLTLISGSEVTAHFDKAWLIEPSTPDANKAVEALQEQFGGLKAEKFISFRDMNPEFDQDLDL
ncbi:MAG: hypothetical protein AAF633_09090 [Chloroflexota bacterium]